MRTRSVRRHESVLDCLRIATREWAGDDVCEIYSDRPAFLWLHGSTMVEASANRDGSVLLRAFLVLHPRPSGNLEAQLRTLSTTLPVGRLVLDEDGDIALIHRVPPRAGRDRLLAAIRDVSCHADLLDDELCARHGGIRSVDKIQEHVRHALELERIPVA